MVALRKQFASLMHHEQRLANERRPMRSSFTARGCRSFVLAGSFVADASTGTPSTLDESRGRRASHCQRARYGHHRLLNDFRSDE